jgi:hypothetical protein
MDDLVQYYRSWPGRRFFYIEVERCLGDVSWPVHECLARVTSKGLERRLRFRKEYPFNGRGILQLSLLGCPPFRGLTENKLRDRGRLWDCPHRPRLFDGLVETLESYEAGSQVLYEDWNRSGFGYTWPAFAWTRRRGLRALQAVESILRELHRGKIPLEDPDLRHHSLDSHINTLHGARDIMIKIRPADEYRASGALSAARVHTRSTLLKMVDTFRAHGPSKFTQSAIYHTLEALSKPLGIRNNDGESYTADAIKKLDRRHLERNIHPRDT